MKYFIFFIGLMMLGFVAAAQTSQRLPIRNSDPVAIPVRVAHVVPMQTSGGGKITPKTAVNIPMRSSGGGKTTPKVVASIPIRTSDGAAGGAGATIGVPATGVKQSGVGQPAGAH